MNGHSGGDVSMEYLRDGPRFASGLILPPPEIKCEITTSFRCPHFTDPPTAVIDRTAIFVARSANPPQFEDKIREGQRSDPKFSFLNPADPYHAYYRNKMEKVAQGDMGDDSAQNKDGQENGAAESAEPVDIGVEPAPPEFIMDLPNISSIDL